MDRVSIILDVVWVQVALVTSILKLYLVLVIHG